LDAGGTLAETAVVILPAGPKTDIPSVDWWTTSRCNLACDFCYGPVPAKDPIELRDDILQAIAASSARAVSFCGGKPLLVTNVEETEAPRRAVTTLGISQKPGAVVNDFNRQEPSMLAQIESSGHIRLLASWSRVWT